MLAQPQSITYSSLLCFTERDVTEDGGMTVLAAAIRFLGKAITPESIGNLNFLAANPEIANFETGETETLANLACICLDHVRLRCKDTCTDTLNVRGMWILVDCECTRCLLP